MQIYIVRHGIAEDGSPGGMDEKRALTAEGKKKMKEAAAGFARLNPDIRRIFASPLVRARQTAEILAIGLKRKVEEMKELSPGYEPEAVVNRLRKFLELESVMLVGHQPNCSELASYMLSADAGIDIEFKKGAICQIHADELRRSSGILIAHYSPASLRTMNQ